MMQLHDLDVQHLKDIPGYKAILKAVIKSQIQGLVEQLADQTGEESVILTASTSDGTLCHLGSLTGKNFLEGRDEIKSQFLRFCLKKQQKRKAPSPPRLSEFSDDEEDNVHPSMSRQSGHQFSPSVSSQSHHTIPQRIHPVALTRVNPGGTPGAGRRTIQSRPYTTTPPHRQDQGRRNTFNKPQSFNSSSSTPSTSSSNITATAVDVHQIDLSQQSIKQEGMAMNTSRDENHDDSFSSHPAFSSSSSPHESGTTTITQSDLSASVKSDQQQRQQLDDTASDEQKKNESNLSNLIPASAGEIDTSNVKIEPVTEGEMELEITGVEMAEGSASFSGDNSWLQNDSQRLGYDPSTSGLDSIAGPSQGGDMASYSIILAPPQYETLTNETAIKLEPSIDHQPLPTDLEHLTFKSGPSVYHSPTLLSHATSIDHQPLDYRASIDPRPLQSEYSTAGNKILQTNVMETLEPGNLSDEKVDQTPKQKTTRIRRKTKAKQRKTVFGRKTKPNESTGKQGTSVVGRKDWKVPVFLTMEQKLQLIRDYEHNPNLTKKDLSAMYDVGLSTVGELLRMKEFYKNMNDGEGYKGYKKKCLQRKTRRAEMNDRLMQWAHSAFVRNETLTGSDVKKKAIKLANELKVTNFMASDGWLNHWKRSYFLVTGSRFLKGQ